MDWILVPGGVCSFGDEGRLVRVRSLYWSRTPLTWADVGSVSVERAADEPATRFTLAEARDLAKRLRARLPTSVEWEWMAAGVDRRPFPWGDAPWAPERANLRRSGIGHVVPVGRHPAGSTPEGVADVAGNVWEWTSSRVLGDGAILRGGSYNALVLYADTRFLNAAPAELRSPGIGVRVVRPA